MYIHACACLSVSVDLLKSSIFIIGSTLLSIMENLHFDLRIDELGSLYKAPT